MGTEFYFLLALIAAGFIGDELPRSLGLDPSLWRWEITHTWLGAYRMIAERHS